MQGFSKNLKASDYYEKKVQSMKEEVRIWKLPGWLLRHFKEAQGSSSPRKTVLYLSLIFAGPELLLFVLSLFQPNFQAIIPMLIWLILAGPWLILATVLHFFRIIVIRKECYDCQFGFYVIAHELNHVNLNALNDEEDLVDRETQKQIGDRFFPLLLSNPVLCKNCAFRKKKYRAAAEEYAKNKKNLYG